MAKARDRQRDLPRIARHSLADAAALLFAAPDGLRVFRHAARRGHVTEHQLRSRHARPQAIGARGKSDDGCEGLLNRKFVIPLIHRVERPLFGGAAIALPGSIAGDAESDAVGTTKLLDVDMDQFARLVAPVVDGGLAGLDSG